MSGNVWWEDSYVLSLMSPLSPFKRNSMLLPGTEVIVWGRLGSPLVNILFRTKLLSLIPLSWDMNCLLTLRLTLLLVPLVTVAVSLVFWSLSFLKEVSCTTAYIYTHRKIIKAPLLHQSLGPRVFFFFSLSFSLLLSYRWLCTTKFWSIKGLQQQLTPVLLPGESQGQRSQVGCRLWGHAELDTTEVT